MKSLKPKEIKRVEEQKVENPIVIRDYLFKGSLWNTPIVVSTVFADTKDLNGYMTQVENLPVDSMRDYKTDVIDVKKDFSEAESCHNQVVEGWLK